MSDPKPFLDAVKKFGHGGETAAHFHESRALFEKVVLDFPEFAPGHGWLAYVNAQGFVYGFFPETDLPLAERLAHKAVALDNTNFDNYWSLAEVCHRMGKVGSAYEAFQDALRLQADRDNPQERADLLVAWAELLNKRGDRQKALDAVNEAIELVDNIPDYYLWEKAGIQYLMKDHIDCLITLKKMKAVPVWSRPLFAANYIRLVEQSLAEKEMQEFLTTVSDWTRVKEVKTEARSFPQADQTYWLDALTQAKLPD